MLTRIPLLAFAFAALGCGSDPRDVIDCDSSWFAIVGSAGASCERACVPMPQMTGAACSPAADPATGSIGMCGSTFVAAGSAGCCGLATSTPRSIDIVLYTCQ